MVVFDDKPYDLDDHFVTGQGNLLNDVERQQQQSLHRSEHDLTLSRQVTKNERSTAFLDGLRGVAAVCVFNQHFIGASDHERGFGNGYYYFISLPFVRIFYNGGSAAVSIFFVLSGYVLSQTLVKLFLKGQRRNLKKSLVSAIVRRPFRLYLPCLAIALITALLMQLPYNFYPELLWSKAQETLGAELVNWFVKCVTFLNPFQQHGSDRGWFQYNLVMWTIPIELKGSMLVYGVSAVCCLGFGLRLWTVPLLLITTGALLQLGWWVSACFISGVALTIVDLQGLDMTYILRHLSTTARTLVMHLIFIVGYYLLSQPAVAGKPEWSLETPGWHTLTYYTPEVYSDAQYYRFWQSYGAILFVYSVLRIRWLQTLFGSRILRYVGKVSFMLYLIHLPLLYCVGDRMVRVFGQVGLGAEPKWWDNLLYVPDIGPKGLSLRWLIMWSLMLALILGVSDIGTRYIDTPSVTLGKKLSQKLGLNVSSRSRPIETSENR